MFPDFLRPQPNRSAGKKVSARYADASTTRCPAAKRREVTVTGSHPRSSVPAEEDLLREGDENSLPEDEYPERRPVYSPGGGEQREGKGGNEKIHQGSPRPQGQEEGSTPFHVRKPDPGGRPPPPVVQKRGIEEQGRPQQVGLKQQEPGGIAGSQAQCEDDPGEKENRLDGKGPAYTHFRRFPFIESVGSGRTAPENGRW